MTHGRGRELLRGAGARLEWPRRTVLWLPLVLAAPAAHAAGSVRFRVMREGSDIGSHAVVVQQRNGHRTALTSVDIAVRLLGVTVYRYTHRFEEVWSGDRLLSVSSRLDRNGTISEMQARAEGAAILVRGPNPGRLPAEAAPLSWWDPATLARPLFHAATGRALNVRVARLPAPGGGFRIRLTGDSEGEATYDRTGSWIGHVLTGDDGSTITYVRA